MEFMQFFFLEFFIDSFSKEMSTDQTPSSLEMQLDPRLLEKRQATQNKRAAMVKRLDTWINFMASQQFAEMDFYECKMRMDRGREIMSQMEQAQLDCMAVAAADAALVYGNEFMDLEERYLTASARLTRRFVELTPVTEPQPANNAGGAANEQQTIKVQLPTQQNNIPNTWGYFDGNLLRWREFRERFLAVIGNDNDVTPIFKFTYLKTSLKGKAADVIKGYDVNEANYKAAWDKLIDEYNPTYPIARKYLEHFFKLKPVGTPATADELRQICNTTNESMQNLQGLEFPVQHWDMIIVHVLHGLLNNDLAYRWNLKWKKEHAGKPTIKNMIDFLDEHAKAATNVGAIQPLTISIPNPQANRNQMASATPSGSSSRSNSQPNSRSSSRNRMGNQSMAQASGSAQGSDEPWKFPCGKCKGNHKIFFCPEWNALGYDARIRIVRKHGLCILCLKKGHTVDRCFDLHRCPVPQCQKDNKHNSHTCPYQVNSQVARPAQYGPAGGNARGHSASND